MLLDFSSLSLIHSVRYEEGRQLTLIVSSDYYFYGQTAECENSCFNCLSITIKVDKSDSSQLLTAGGFLLVNAVESQRTPLCLRTFSHKGPRHEHEHD